ncbi:hypothetical protein MRB53_037402 [Persea americana]|nr:hypothetical protein MRB53_037402 [Persea americana]
MRDSLRHFCNCCLEGLICLTHEAWHPRLDIKHTPKAKVPWNAESRIDRAFYVLLKRALCFAFSGCTVVFSMINRPEEGTYNPGPRSSTVLSFFAYRCSSFMQRSYRDGDCGCDE